MKGGARIALALAAAIATPTAAATLHVDADAAAAGDGTGWTTAYRFLQDALAFASVPANGVTEIRIAQGLYTPDRDEANPSGTGDREATFQLINGVMILGGYAGAGEPDPDARDIAQYPTVLSGDLLGNDDGPPSNGAENSYNVATGSGTDTTAVVDGLTITGGRATALPGSPDHHRSGGGVRIVAGSPTLIDCVITGHLVLDDGGGLYIAIGSSPVITRCTFSDNVAFQAGGGIFNTQASHPVITDCVFSNNTAQTGGGIANDTDCDPSISGCTFAGNHADFSGGGVYNLTNCSPTVIDCTFTDNTADEFNGGGLNNRVDSSPTIIGCVFKNNQAVHNGGAIGNFSGCNPSVVNCLFVGNTAGDWGGAIRAGIDSSPVVINGTFVGNTAGAGGAFSAGSQNVGGEGDCVLSNCVLWNNTAGQGPQIAIIGNNPSNIAVDHCDVEGGLAATHVMNGGILDWGAGNIDANPLFLDALGANYRLTAGSPCVDPGNNASVPPAVNTDLDDNPRFVDDGCTPDMGSPPAGAPYVDMGAFEFQTSSCDVNGDGVVGINDFLTLLASWGPCPRPCPPSCATDFDDDCQTGITDFLMLLADWG